MYWVERKRTTNRITARLINTSLVPYIRTLHIYTHTPVPTASPFPSNTSQSVRTAGVGAVCCDLHVVTFERCDSFNESIPIHKKYRAAKVTLPFPPNRTTIIETTVLYVEQIQRGSKYLHPHPRAYSACITVPLKYPTVSMHGGGGGVL